jgi:hypothetical protein
MRTSLFALASLVLLANACAVPVSSDDEAAAGDGADADLGDMTPDESPSKNAEELVSSAPPSASYYGNLVHGDSVGNTPTFKDLGTMRFRAERSGKVTSLAVINRVHRANQADLHLLWDRCHESPPGGDWTKLHQCELDAWYGLSAPYHKGDGGLVQLELHEDDGHGFPKAAALSVAKHAFRPVGTNARYVGTSHGMKFYVVAPSAPTIVEEELEAPVHVEAGKLYHVVLRQLAPEKGELCLDGVYTYEPLTPVGGPAFGDDQAVMIRDSASAGWRAREHIQPNYGLVYDDGVATGTGYMTVGSMNAATVCGLMIGQHHRARQTFTIHDHDRRVDKVLLRLGRDKNGLAPLKVTLDEGSHALASGTVTESKIGLHSGDASAFPYVEVKFASPIKLVKGRSYSLDIAAPTSSAGYFAFAAVGQEELGLESQAWGAPDAKAWFSTDDGAHWSSWKYKSKDGSCHDAPGADLQVMFHVVP